MTRIVVAPEVEADLLDIEDRIAETAGHEIATKYILGLLTTIERLATVPLASGRLVPQLGSDLRCHPFGNYNLYLRYHVGTDELQVVRTLHGRRNITAASFEPEA